MKKDRIVRDKIDRGRRNFLKTLSLTGAGMAVGGVPAIVHSQKKDIAIGCVVSLTGFMSIDGQTMTEGLELAIEDLNAKGGLLGRQVTGLYRDDETMPNIAIRRFTELVKTQGIRANCWS